jgi:replicative DNA helicase
VSYLGGRPGIGKTVAATCIAANVAAAGYSIGFFSADMTGLVLKQRLAFYLAHLEGVHTPFFSEMRKPDSPWLTPEFRKQMAGFLKGDVGQRFMVNDKASVKTSFLSYQIRAWKRECERRRLPPLGLVIIDHLGKVAPQQASRGLYEKTSYATNELLEASKDHPEIATLCLVQLSRVSDQERRRPELHDMRDSGKIEEDASAVILLHREDYYLQRIIKNLGSSEKDREAAQAALSSCRGHAEFIIGKNRNGEADVVVLRHTIGKNIIREPVRVAGKVQEEPQLQEELF